MSYAQWLEFKEKADSRPVDDNYQGMWVLIHVHGCGGPVSLRTHKPEYTDPVTAEPVRHLDGSRVNAEDPVICETCNKPLGVSDIFADYFIPYP